MERLQASDLIYLAPELTLVISAIIISLIDLMLPKRVNRDLMGWLSLLGIVGSAAFVLFYSIPLVNGDSSTGTISLLRDSYRIDDFANIMKLILLGGGALITFMSIGAVKEQEIPHRGEYYYLLLPALVGGMIMASSGELITLFVGLELLSITSYILVAIRKNRAESSEGAFKYLVTGSIASAFILYGMSFLYGMTGSTNLTEIRTLLTDATFYPLLYVSFFFMIGGFAFKVAAAPFHTWAPDVYQGAATPVTAFLATISKAAGFAILFRVVYVAFYGLGSLSNVPIHTDFFFLLMLLAAAAMILGNAMALREKNVKRLMAYSGVANAGYLLVPILNDPYSTQSTMHYTMASEFFYYLVAYVLMNIGMFAAIMIVTGQSDNEEVSAFSGLYYRAPGLAIGVVILVLSLAGIPITGGFFGKFYIMFGAVQSHIYWLAVVMIITSVVSYYYYFSIIRQMFMRTALQASNLVRSIPLSSTLWICVVLSVAMGVFPHYVIDWIESIFVYEIDLFG